MNTDLSSSVVLSPSSLMMRGLDELCHCLRQQHALDLEVYRSSHQEWKNRRLHQVLIPIECFSAFLFITGACFHFLSPLFLSELQLYLLLVGVIGWTMGIISIVIAPVDQYHPWTGIASFVFMIAAPWISFIVVKRCKQTGRLIVFAFVSWVLASSLQVAVGHWLWELKDPDVLNGDNQVSILSLTHSVQIAWSS
jgi:uncharacterized membrane protein YGL010W